jgi:hypothetical protein
MSCDQRRAGAGEAGDAMDAGGLKGFGQDHGQQDGRQPPRQPRCPRPRRAQQQDVGVRTPASRSAALQHRRTHVGWMARPRSRAGRSRGATPRAAAWDLRRWRCRGGAGRPHVGPYPQGTARTLSERLRSWRGAAAPIAMQTSSGRHPGRRIEA